MGSIPLVGGAVREDGRRRNPSLKPSAEMQSGLNEAVMARKQVCLCNRLLHKRILSRGLGPFGSLNLALVGSLHLATSAAGATSSGVRAKNPAMKSSTMKGAKALGSKF